MNFDVLPLFFPNTTNDGYYLMTGIPLVNSPRRGLFRGCAKAMKITVRAGSQRLDLGAIKHSTIYVSYVETLVVEKLLTMKR